MIFRERYSGKWVVLFFALLLVIPFLFLKGCGGGGYADPKDPKALVEVLVSPETVYNWVTKGYGTDEFGYNKMVILDVSPKAGYLGTAGPGHIPGAYLLENTYLAGVTSIRSDGVADIPNMMAGRGAVDQLLRDMGIDEKTVILFTGMNVRMPQFGYYNFRYWGFPRERLKVMDGTTYVYAQKYGYPMEKTVPPAPAPSTYSVCQLKEQNISTRASLSEMIKVVDGNDPNAVIVDARMPFEYNGTLPPPGFQSGRDGLIIPSPPAPTTPEFVAFEGHIKNAVNIPYTSLIGDYSTSGLVIHPQDTAEIAVTPYLPKKDLIAMLNAKGIDSSKTVYIYDTFSWKASVLFLLILIKAPLNHTRSRYDSGTQTISKGGLK